MLQMTCVIARYLQVRVIYDNIVRTFAKISFNNMGKYTKHIIERYSKHRVIPQDLYRAIFAYLLEPHVICNIG